MSSVITFLGLIERRILNLKTALPLLIECGFLATGVIRSLSV